MKTLVKRRLSALLAAVMLLSLAACGNSKPESAKQTDSASAEATQTETQQQEKVAYVFASPKSISTDFVDLTYDEADGWVLGEDVYDEETYSELELAIPFEEGAVVDRDEVLEQEGEGVYDQKVYVDIIVEIEEASAFRSNLEWYGFDQRKFADHDYEFTNIGGADCALLGADNWGVTKQLYMGRVENANASVYIWIVGAEPGDERVDKLLSGLTFDLEDTGNIDPPWPWEGEPISCDSFKANIEGYVRSSEWLPIKDCLTIEWFRRGVATVGNDVYILCYDSLERYEYDGTSLTFAEEIELGGEYNDIFADENGTLYLSSEFGEPPITLKDGVQTAFCPGISDIIMHPSGTWGLSTLPYSQWQKCIFSDGTYTTQTIAFDEVEDVSDIFIDENHIYVIGYAADGNGETIFVYDENGNFEMLLTGVDLPDIDDVIFVAETDNGFMVLDGGKMCVISYDKYGEYVSDMDCDELFGRQGVYLFHAAPFGDGSFLAIAAADRDDKSATELLAFKLSGF